MSSTNRFFTKRALALMTPGILTGVGIAVLNTVNIDKSPEYKENMSLNDYLRFTAMIGMKSTIYGTFYPFFWFEAGVDAIHSKKHFDSHFIPFSLHGHTWKETTGNNDTDTNVDTNVNEDTHFQSKDVVMAKKD